MARHNLSHYQLFTGNIGELLPIGCIEVLPGDRIRHSTNLVCRLSPMAAPVMHPLRLRVHHFFVPSRRLWDGADTGDPAGESWENFITGGPDGLNADTIPTVNTTGTASDIMDYFGLPQVAGVAVNALPLRAYNQIFNEWYRDQDLVTERALTDYSVANIAYEKDYFTTARPWEIKGPDIQLSLGTRADVRGIGYGVSPTITSLNLRETGPIFSSSVQASTTNAGSAQQISALEDSANSGYPDIYADLSTATGVSINAFRNAFALQRWAERRAQEGSRYDEVLRSEFRTRPMDGRLSRPEFLGGSSTRLQISEVLQTAPETIVAGTEYGVGDLYGHGIGALGSAPYRRTIPEHGYVISLASVRPKALYQNGAHRMWLRQDKEDFYWRDFEGIGEQAVTNNEIYASVANGGDTFGYQARYNEYREHPSLVTSEFRDLLDYWHLGRDFGATPPALNSDFVQTDPADFSRIFQEQTNDQMWCFAQHNIQALRPVSKKAYGTIR